MEILYDGLLNAVRETLIKGHLNGVYEHPDLLLKTTGWETIGHKEVWKLFDDRHPEVGLDMCGQSFSINSELISPSKLITSTLRDAESTT